ncbi:hypothetical protein JCM8547_002723 [Rhodosporidiobolus lusitaniae]
MNPLQWAIPPPPNGMQVNPVEDPRSRPVTASWGISSQLVTVADQYHHQHAAHEGLGEPVFDAAVGLVLFVSQLADRSFAEALYDQHPPLHYLKTSAYFSHIVPDRLPVRLAIEYPGFDQYWDEEAHTARWHWCIFQHMYEVEAHQLPRLLQPFTRVYTVPESNTHLNSLSPTGIVLSIGSKLQRVSRGGYVWMQQNQVLLRDLRITMFAMEQAHLEAGGTRGDLWFLYEEAKRVVAHRNAFPRGSSSSWRSWALSRADIMQEYIEEPPVALSAADVERETWREGNDEPEEEELVNANRRGWTLALRFFLDIAAAAATTSSYSLAKRSPFHPLSRSPL